MKIQNLISSIPIVGLLATLCYRAKAAIGLVVRYNLRVLKWLFLSKETTNLTYGLTPLNRRHLIVFLSNTLKCSYEEIEGYFKELESDSELASHIAKTTNSSSRSFKCDRIAKYHKRLGWYALVRHLKPKLVVETGVDKGLGSVVLASAVLRNRELGFEGRYLGTDINPAAGFLLSGRYTEAGEILYGDSLESLKTISEPIGLFINDSDHSAAYEMEEYLMIAPKLSESGVIVGDNAHVTEKLLDYSLKEGREFAYWQEEPENHWYRGAGIGLSWSRAQAATSDEQK